MKKLIKLSASMLIALSFMVSGNVLAMNHANNENCKFKNNSSLHESSRYKSSKKSQKRKNKRSLSSKANK